MELLDKRRRHGKQRISTNVDGRQVTNKMTFNEEQKKTSFELITPTWLGRS